MKSARMTFLMSAEDKAAIAARAAALGITASELVRRAVEHFEPNQDEAALSLLAGELAKAVDRTEEKVDSALQGLAQMRAYFDALDQERAKSAAKTAA